MSKFEENEWRKIKDKTDKIDRLIAPPVLVNTQNGRIAIRLTDGLYDLEDNPTYVGGTEEEIKKINKLAHHVNMLTKKYIEQYGTFDPLKIFEEGI
jgi:hypothetical protein